MSCIRDQSGNNIRVITVLCKFFYRGLKLFITYNVNVKSMTPHCIDQIRHIDMVAVAGVEYGKSPVCLYQSQYCKCSRINW